MPMNLACCFIHAAYEYKRKRDRREGGGAREIDGRERKDGERERKKIKKRDGNEESV